MASQSYSYVPQSEDAAAVVGVPVQRRGGTFIPAASPSICDRFREPVGSCCCCFTLRQGVIVLAVFNIVGGLLCLCGSLGFGVLLSNWDFVMDQMKDQADSQDVPPQEALDQLQSYLPALEAMSMVAGVFQIILAAIGMFGAIKRHKKASKYYSYALTLCVIIIALMSLGGVVEFILNVGISAYCAKVAWSWYLSLLHEENSSRVENYSSWQPIEVPMHQQRVPTAVV